MKAVSKIMTCGAAIAALAAAAPAAAQYPGSGYGSGYGSGTNNVVGQILNSILGGRSYGQNDRSAIDMCVRATEARLNGYQGGYGYNNYGNYGGYGNYGYNQGYNGSRVTAITLVERRSNGGLKIHGNATASNSNQGYGGDHHNPYSQGSGGYNQGYGGYNQGYGYNKSYATQLTFHCKVNSRGQVTDVDIDRRRY